jgi:hypothetical protein
MSPFFLPGAFAGVHRSPPPPPPPRPPAPPLDGVDIVAANREEKGYLVACEQEYYQKEYQWHPLPASDVGSGPRRPLLVWLLVVRGRSVSAVH